MKKFIPGDFRLQVKRARTGRGLFALELIPKGACVIEYIGRPATKKEEENDTAKYLFWASDTLVINGNIPQNKARFINHSCKPNCEADGPDGRVFIVALRNIKPGEELTYDYGDEYFEQHFKAGGCRCATCASPRPRATKSLRAV